MERLKKSNIDITVLEKGKFTAIKLLRIFVALICITFVDCIRSNTIKVM